ncbi:polyhydroxyalkanoate depolymerase [Pleomorphomonas sp. PLEO]|uniref:polyhydroxyalkanoate depolymerase n=1 Tax=Pleomorphomonas sp. PLEO TaxID=3239306 RepID=UPI00351EC11E
MPYYHSYSGSQSARAPLLPAHRPPAASGFSADLYARVARRYCHPTFNLGTTFVSGVRGPVFERVVRATPFWTLTAFDRASINPDVDSPSVLVLPPYAGHCPTLVRDTIATFMPGHAVYVAGWADARQVPLSAGAFGLDEAIEAIADMVIEIGGRVHLVAVTEAGIIGVAAAALLAGRGRPPATLTLIGGPIDCRADNAGLAAGATARGVDWFLQAMIAPVPPPFEGAYREVFPGFFTLTGFPTYGFDRSLTDPKELFLSLITGDGDDADGRRGFFDEFLAVMDVPAEFMLQWIETVLINRPFTAAASQTGHPHATPPLAGIPLMTVEAGMDAFGGGGQTHAAHMMTSTPSEGCRHTEEDVGRFALFSGARWRASVFPRVADFIASHTSQEEPSCTALAEDLLTLSGLTPAFAARLNREGFYFVRQLARLDEAAAVQLDRRLGIATQPIVAQVSHQARRHLAGTGAVLNRRDGKAI